MYKTFRLNVFVGNLLNGKHLTQLFLNNEYTSTEWSLTALAASWE